MIKRVLLPGSRGRKIAEVLYGRMTRGKKIARVRSYANWIKQTEPQTLAPIRRYSYEPLISIVVPAFNTPDKYLIPLLESFKSQTYQNWQLCLVNASPDAERAHAIEQQSKSDKRITHIKLNENLGIAGNTNRGLEEARGEFIAFCDHDDTLAPFALNEVVAALQANSQIDVFYSDEDNLSDDGATRMNPFFKPDWSPELFHTVNYLAHFVVVRAELVKKVKGLRTGFDGAQDYDFLLRVFDLTDNIHHISHISYHWRQAEGSTARGTDQKNYADDAGQRAIGDYVRRNNIDADVLPFFGLPTEYRLKYLAKKERVAIVLSGSIVKDMVQKTIKGSEWRVAYITEGDIPELAPKLGYVVFLDVEPTTDSWLEELTGIASQPGVGMVGTWLHSNDKGIGYTVDDVSAEEYLSAYSASEWTFQGQPRWPRNVLAVAPGCAIIKSELLKQAINDGCGLSPFELSTYAFKKGRRNVFWPFLTFSRSDAEPSRDFKTTLGLPADPYLNSNLVARSGKVELRH